MAVPRQKKEEILADLIQKMKTSKSVFFTKNLGMTVLEAQNIRKLLREGGNSYHIAKKTLIKKAAQEGIEVELNDAILEGAIGAAFAMQNELAVLKLLSKLEKDTKKLEITGGIFEGKVINQTEAVALSKIPSREELLAKLLGALLSPINGFAGANCQVIAGFVRVLDSYRASKA